MLKEDQPRATFEIDGGRFSTLDGFYDEFTRAVIPGIEWGHNLDALNDVLRGGMGTPEGGFDLIWRNSAKSRLDLGHAETVRQLERRLSRCHPSNRAGIESKIEVARQNQGDTVFDWLVEVLESLDEVKVMYQ